MAFCSVRFLNMGVMKLHNCTRWRLRYWRSTVDDRTYFVEPGDVGEYTWGTTYTLNAEVADDGSMSQGSREAVNQSGDYYAYCTNGKITIYDYEQFQSCMPNDDNPYVNIWGVNNRNSSDDCRRGGLVREESPHQRNEHRHSLHVDGSCWLPGCHGVHHGCAIVPHNRYDVGVSVEVRIPAKQIGESANSLHFHRIWESQLFDTNTERETRPLSVNVDPLPLPQQVILPVFAGTVLVCRGVRPPVPASIVAVGASELDARGAHASEYVGFALCCSNTP